MSSEVTFCGRGVLSMNIDTRYVNPHMYEVIIARLLIGVVIIGMIIYLPQGIYFYVVFGILLLLALHRSTWLEVKYLMCERNILTKDMRLIQTFYSKPDLDKEILQQEFRFRSIFQENAVNRGVSSTTLELYTYALLAAKEVYREQTKQALCDQELLTQLGGELAAIDEKIALLKK